MGQLGTLSDSKISAKDVKQKRKNVSKKFLINGNPKIFEHWWFTSFFFVNFYFMALTLPNPRVHPKSPGWRWLFCHVLNFGHTIEDGRTANLLISGVFLE